LEPRSVARCSTEWVVVAWCWCLCSIVKAAVPVVSNALHTCANQTDVQ